MEAPKTGRNVNKGIAAQISFSIGLFAPLVLRHPVFAAVQPL